MEWGRVSGREKAVAGVTLFETTYSFRSCCTFNKSFPGNFSEWKILIDFSLIIKNPSSFLLKLKLTTEQKHHSRFCSLALAHAELY